MRALEYFFAGYFNQSVNYSDLEDLIQEFKDFESKQYVMSIVAELAGIIKKGNYKRVSQIIRVHGGRNIKGDKKVERLITYLYERFTNQKIDNANSIIHEA